MRLDRAIAVAVFVGALLGNGTEASADITGFLGLAGGPSVRMAKGVAVGFSLVIVGVELEYSDTTDNIPEGAPQIRTGMVNVLLQTPDAVGGVQFYGTAGAGVYHQDLASVTETNVGVNLGGGIKITLVGPLRVRIDYRMFRFSSSHLGHDVVNRIYVGANLKF